MESRFTRFTEDHPQPRATQHRGMSTASPVARPRLSLTRPLPVEWSSQLLSVLRIVAAFLFMLHGSQKLLAFPVAGPQGPVEIDSLMGVAGVLELVGGMFLLFGLLTRPIAFLLSGEMAVAYFMQHAPKGFWPMLNGGELAALYSFLFLYIAAAGPGVWSLDALLARSHRLRWSDRTDHRYALER